jgi:hypothetical protein
LYSHTVGPGSVLQSFDFAVDVKVTADAAKFPAGSSDVAQTCFSNRHFRVELMVGEAMVRVTRLARPFTSAEDAMQGCLPMLAALDAIGRQTHFLLFDSRLAIGRNDPEYEQWFAPHRRDLVRGFPKVAVVVNTSVGRLHSQRLLSADSEAARFRVFDDYVLALAFVRGAIRASTPPVSQPRSVPPSSAPVSSGPKRTLPPGSKP